MLADKRTFWLLGVPLATVVHTLLKIIVLYLLEMIVLPSYVALILFVLAECNYWTQYVAAISRWFL